MTRQRPSTRRARIDDEAYLSALGDTPQTHARISGADENTRRPVGYPGAPRQGSQASWRLKTRNALDLGLTRQRNRAPVSAVAHYCGRALWPRAHALGFSGRLFTALKPQFF